jgi:disulfide bond formation protein DsbB
MTAQLSRRHPRLPFAVTCVTGLGLVIVGVVLSEVLGLAACPLCIIQRMLYLLLALFAGLAMPFAGRLPGRRLGALGLIVAAGTGLFVSGYQVWIQRFSPSTSCSGRMAWWEELVDWAGDQVPILFRASGLCSDPAWKFLGLSIADWSLGMFALLLLLAAHTLLRRQ